jgi:hypothetical protein
MKHHFTTDEPLGRFELHFSSKFYLDGVFAPYGAKGVKLIRIEIKVDKKVNPTLV